MSSTLKTELSHWASAALVIVASTIVGHEAAAGMDAVRWACAAFAVLGSVSVAVMVRVWPAPQKAPAKGGQQG